ncbi:MAG: hypothetical protein AB8D78_13310 [Akkermansiaceae bacterium]
MRGRTPFPIPFLPLILFACIFSYVGSLAPSFFKGINRTDSHPKSGEVATRSYTDQSDDPFSENPADDTRPRSIMVQTKFVQIGSGDDELGFDWILEKDASARNAARPQIDKLLKAMECDQRKTTEAMNDVAETEGKDRAVYNPKHFEIATIIMQKPSKGYHGPTKGSYVFIIEEYANEQAAKKRADEYINPGYRKRIADPDSLEKAGKSSVRCWGVSCENFAYLLTTHASSFANLEKKNRDLHKRLSAFLSN